MAQTAANQLQKVDIRVNTICPGIIETGMTIDTFEYARARGTTDKIGQLNPLGRYGVAQGQDLPTCGTPSLLFIAICWINYRDRERSDIPCFW